MSPLAHLQGNRMLHRQCGEFNLILVVI